jgi:hypothetical protein
MKRISWGIALALVLGLAAGCSGKTSQPSATELMIIPATSMTVSEPPQGSATPQADTSPSGTPVKPGAPAIGLTVKQIAKSATTAAMVVDRQLNQTLLAENTDREFHSGSLVKLMIGLDALQRHPRDTGVASRVATMIRLSDDDIASSFWVSEGGVAIVSRMVRLMNLKSTKPPVQASQWGETIITAADIFRIYDYLMNQAPAGDKETMLRAMASAAPRGSDGFDQRFGIPNALGGQFPWAIKQAWTDDDTTMSVHTTGFVGPNWRYVVIVLVENPKATSWNTATQAITAGVKNIDFLLGR